MIPRAWKGLQSRSRAYWYSFLGATIRRPCWLQSIEIPRNHFDIHLEPKVALDRGVILLATGEKQDDPRIQIGEGTYINRHTMIDASEKINIGSNCMIGPFCYITDHDHGMVPGVPVNQQPLTSKPVILEDNVWIGAHATILKGITIGTGAIIGAGAVVTQNIPPNMIAVGVPARITKSRQQTIQ